MKDQITAQRVYQLYSTMRATMRAGELRPGDRLPGERTLAEEYGISRMAVKRALGRLMDEGLIFRAQGKGTFVQCNQVERLRLNMRPIHGVASISDVLRRQGRKSEIHMIGAGSVPPCAFLTERLELNPGDAIFCLSRVRLANGEPVALENTYLPAKYAPGVEKVNFSRVSLYEYFNAIGRSVTEGGTRLRVVLAGQREAELLHLPEGQAVYLLENTGLTSGALTVEYTESYLRPDRMELFSAMDD